MSLTTTLRSSTTPSAMSNPTLHKQSSSSSWGLKQYLTVAACLVALSQVSIVQACRPSTVKVTYEEVYNEFCYKRACHVDQVMVGSMSLTIRNHYDKSFHYETQNGKSKLTDIGYHCSPDGNFCINVNDDDDVTLHYANKKFKLGAPSVQKGTRHLGESHYYTCL
ncbi:hypothetical protein EC991_005410 [Linnemannia zychae]|nr:hypothetical protein EC991_005410 [Linnemannia zychae]